MRILLLTIGSAGDVHPFIGLGLALRQRGHEVKLITNPYFSEVAKRVGLDLVPLGTIEHYQEAVANPDLWHKRKGTQVVFNMVAEGLREMYEAVAANHVPGDTVMAISSLGFGARIAQDKLNIPTATIHLSPSEFRSLIAPPILPGLPIAAWQPMWFKRFLWWFADNAVIDRMAAPRINALRKELGLTPVRGILRDFWNSPDRVIGMFPDWFCPPQEDWPRQTLLTGFPRYDESNVHEVDPELERFLDAKCDAPIVFTPGSAMHHGHEFFEASVTACKKLNRRGLLLTRHAEQVPADLPATIRHFAYAPFSQVLPRAAALVHHGGIGTSAQALAAGCRQLVTPFAHDQFDNADRLVRLGVAKFVLATKYTAKAAEKHLSDLLSNSSVTERCRDYRDRLHNDDATARTCDLILSLRSEKASFAGTYSIPRPRAAH